MDERNWRIVKTEFDERSIEANNTVFTVANGYLSLKGNLLEYRLGRYPGTFIAALFDRADYFAFVRPVSYERTHFDPKYFDDAGMSPSIANLANPLFTRVFVGGVELSFHRGEIREFEQVYDLRQGRYRYAYVHQDAQGRQTRVEQERFCDMARPHQAHLRYTVTPLNYQEPITLQSGIDGDVRSNLKLDKQFEVLGVSAGGNEATLKLRTFLKSQAAEFAVADRFETAPDAVGEPTLEDGRVFNSYRFEGGKPITLHKVIAATSEEDARHGAAADVKAELADAKSRSWQQAASEQAAWWAEAWDTHDVQIEGDDEAQAALRFCIAHLVSAAPRQSDRLSIPCKLLTGEWYQGTVFYDTDLYIEPVFLYTQPDIAKRMLNYRHVGVEAGKAIAERFGFKGCKLAWQAGPYGEEELGYWWRYTLTNIHINGDVAYSLNQYWNATRDIEFMENQGVDMLVEFSRFYVSRATYDEANGRYDFEMTAGPDEGHNRSKNNFYTNLVAKKTLQWAADWVEKLAAERPAAHAAAKARLGLGEGEPTEWRKLAAGLTFYFDPHTKVYEQYEGYYELQPVPPNLLTDRKEWWTPVFPYQAIHQPDVVMAIWMFLEEFDPEVVRANFEYYKPRTMNFSSMSFVINSIMAKHAGDMEWAYEQFVLTSQEDLNEELTQRYDVHDGIHGTASGGAWLAAVEGFGGVRWDGQTLRMEPRLPANWKSLAFKFKVLGATLSFNVTPNAVSVGVEAPPEFSLPATLWGQAQTLKGGQRYELPYTIS